MINETPKHKNNNKKHIHTTLSMPCVQERGVWGGGGRSFHKTPYLQQTYKNIGWKPYWHKKKKKAIKRR
eukprot:m.5325 g.5325  ORF g.5325 m.5325 type:complete len:69 (-) comp2381_c0_seq1:1533-1739(-)